MTRVYVWFARPAMHLAEAVTAPDGRVVAGAGTRLGPSLVRTLAAAGVEHVAVAEDHLVAPWECVLPVDEALAALDRRFAAEPADPILEALHEALRRRLIATAPGAT